MKNIRKRHTADRIALGFWIVDVIAPRYDGYDDHAARREGARFFCQFSGVSSETVQLVAEGSRVSTSRR